jgi:hypothetical protein
MNPALFWETAKELSKANLAMVKGESLDDLHTAFR